MKSAGPLLLALSLALNVVLGLIFMTGSRPLPGSAVVPVTAVAPPALDADVWRSFETAHQSDQVARLRAAGFPTDVIRAILRAQFEEELTARTKLLSPEAGRQPYWKSRPPDPQVQAALSKLRREHQKAVRDLLGEEVDSNQMINQILPGRRVDGLPPEKAAAALEVVRAFEERRADLIADPLHPSNPEKRAALDRAQREALTRVLEPRELEDYDLQNSPVAMSMRMQLSAFAPTEDEFRAIFRLRQAFDLQHGSSIPAGATVEQLRQRTEAERLLSDRIREALGPGRAEEYTRKSDFGYVQTNKIVERLELPPKNTDQIYAVQRDITARARALNADRSLPDESRAGQLTALREEATRRLTPLLGGSRGLEVYRQNTTPWLDALQPRRTGTPATAPSPRL